MGTPQNQMIHNQSTRSAILTPCPPSLLARTMRLFSLRKGGPHATAGLAPLPLARQLHYSVLQPQPSDGERHRESSRAATGPRRERGRGLGKAAAARTCPHNK